VAELQRPGHMNLAVVEFQLAGVDQRPITFCRAIGSSADRLGTATFTHSARFE